MQNLQQEVQTLRELMRDLLSELREDIRIGTQRILDALVAHEHDTDGGVIFRAPPTQAPNPAADG